MVRNRSLGYRVAWSGALLPGWLPVAQVPHAPLWMEHLSIRHPGEFSPRLQRMATEDSGPVVMEAFAQVDITEEGPLSPTKRGDPS